MEETAEVKRACVDGAIVAMAGVSRAHNEIVSNLIREVGNCLKGKGRAIYPSDFRVTTPVGKSYFYPDATVVCGDLEMQPDAFDSLQNPVIVFRGDERKNRK